MRACGENWAYAQAHAAAIDEHWARRSVESPRLFNGAIYVARGMTLESGALDVEFTRIEFKSFLYWREQGYPDTGVRDCFGSALIRSSEGHVLLGRQNAGNMNGGLAYMPGGFIDPRDVGPDGTIDVAASIAREVREETGLQPQELRRLPGHWVTFCGPLVSIATEFRSRETAQTLRERMRRGLARDAEAELDEIVVVRSMSDAPPGLVPPYARLLLARVLADGEA